ncbi:MAG: hypothetical protein HY321_04880 [Armatimonadetes bacterium]|nr:hypothetical protein [Armatimonadota bacterium]
MPRRKEGRQECFGRKNIMTLTCYTLCHSGRCSDDDQVACEEATEKRLMVHGLLPRQPEPVRG